MTLLTINPQPIIPAMSLFTSLLPVFSHSRSPIASRNDADGTASARIPAYTLHETDDDYTVTVNLPGVTKDNLTVTAEDGVLTIAGKRSWQQPEGWTPLHLESADADYSLSFTYADAIDAEKISAALNDGVLKLTLPKSETRKPRKITVN
jgi:HSP20 family protein